MSDVEATCSKCDHDYCVFKEFRREFIETDTWRVERELIEGRIDPGNLRQRALRKKLYMSFARFNGAIGVREKCPDCVERGIRELLPSPFYMGYKRTRDDPDNAAVNIDGKKIDNVKWVKTEAGKYKAEENTNEVEVVDDDS